MGVSLQKGQQISLAKAAKSNLSKVTLGLGWDAVKPKGLFAMFSGPREIDLDASCILFDANKRQVDVVWFRQLMSKCGSVSHTGDNRTGAGDGDDEQIIVDLSRVPPTVESLVFTVNSFTGQTFDLVENAYVRLVNNTDQQELCRYDLSCKGDYKAQVMCKLWRDGGDWQLQAIGASGTGATFEDLKPVINQYL